jgi:hypothetical protein
MANDANSVDNGKSSVPSTQLQPHKNPINEETKSSEITDNNALLPARFTKPLFLLTLVVILLSLVVLVIPSCNEVSVQVRFWGFGYQLIKKSNCSASSGR